MGTKCLHDIWRLKNPMRLRVLSCMMSGGLLVLVTFSHITRTSLVPGLSQKVRPVLGSRASSAHRAVDSTIEHACKRDNSPPQHACSSPCLIWRRCFPVCVHLPPLARRALADVALPNRTGNRLGNVRLSRSRLRERLRTRTGLHTIPLG